MARKQLWRKEFDIQICSVIAIAAMKVAQHFNLKITAKLLLPSMWASAQT